MLLKLAIVWALSFTSLHAQIELISGGASTGHYTINIAGPTANNYPFINYVKTCNAFRLQSASSFVFPTILNADGYPQSSPPSGAPNLTCGFAVPANANYSGHWIIAWKGQFGTGVGAGGTAGVQISLSAGTATVFNGSYGPNSTNFVVTNSSGVLSLTGTDGVVEFTPPTTSTNFSLFFLANTPISAITAIGVCRVDQVSIATASADCLNNAGNIFNPDYLAFLNRLNPRRLRMLAWNGNQSNQNNNSRYAYDPPKSAMTYVNGYYSPTTGTWAGVEAGVICTGSNCGAGTSCFSGTIGTNYCGGSAPDTPVSYTDGEVYQGLIATQNSSTTPTLDVGGRGAKTIKSLSIAALPTSGSTSLQPNVLNTFVYSAKLDIWMVTAGGMTASVPLTVQAELCNATHRDCWFNIPHLYDATSATNWGESIRTTLNSSNKAIVEYSNEFWITGAQASWGFAQGTARSLPKAGLSGTGNTDMYGLMFRTLFGTNIYPNWTGSDAGRLIGIQSVFVVGIFAQNLQYNMQGFDLTLDASGNYCTGGGCTIVTNYSVAPNRPIDFMSAISNAMYFRGSNLPESDSKYITLQAAKNITGISNTNPGVVTVSNHGYSNGDRVLLSSAINGMTELRNTYVTVANAATNTFEISNVVNGSAAQVSSDTSGFGVWTSGGTTERQVPGVNTALLTAADQWNSGTTANRATAAAWLYNDVLTGTRDNGAGTPTLNVGTMQYYGATTWPSYQSTFNLTGLPTLLYEGAYDGIDMSSTTAIRLGIDPVGCVGATCYYTKIANLKVGFKAMDLFRNLVYIQNNTLRANVTNASPAWLTDVTPNSGLGPIWSLVVGDIYTAPYQSFDGVRDVNAGQ